MPSLIPGYTFDIFISYRHKDNKYDGWVTEFAANLKKEVEATFKEEVSIYFDENPYDGILEAHNVDQTINNKIRCLVFIPVLSQTYCDQKSFAWNSEFLAFIKFTTEDKKGLNIRLRNGNVTSRIIPVRIHDLDEGDKRLVESATGGSLRAIDFVFKGPGINRPLSSNELSPQENQIKINYRDQINKVANLLKEIIVSLKSNKEFEPVIQRNIPASKFSFGNGRILIAITAVIACCVLYYFYSYTALFYRNSQPGEQVTLAVLPLKVIDNEDESRYFAEGVTETILFNLSMFPQLKVKARTSVEKYKDDKKSIEEIADELGVNFILEGSAQKVKDDIRIIVKLVDIRNDKNVWSRRFDKKFKNLFEIQNEISEAIARSLKTTLTSEIRNKLKKVPTSNFDAYDLFLRARQLSKRYANTLDKADLHLGINLLEQSLRKDPEFAGGYAWLAALKTLRDAAHLSEKNVRDSIILLANTALTIDSSVTEAHLVLGEMYSIENDDVNALRYTFQALRSPAIDSALTYSLVKRLATVYARVGYTDRALFLLDQILLADPDNLDVLSLKFYALAADHRIEDLLLLAERIKTIKPDDIYVQLIMTHVWIEGSNYNGVEKIYDTIKPKVNDQFYLLEQYGLIYAWVLRENKKNKEAIMLAKIFEDLFADDDYFKAQLQLYKGSNKNGLESLFGQEVGWYNLNLCRINPVFQKVKEETRFKDFLTRNEEKLTSKKERIRQLEQEGYLQIPENLFTLSITGSALDGN